jgi:hypothetical protein
MSSPSAPNVALATPVHSPPLLVCSHWAGSSGVVAAELDDFRPRGGARRPATAGLTLRVIGRALARHEVVHVCFLV